jgi:curli biogenesis system outer membrane secretion channel CsgG
MANESNDLTRRDFAKAAVAAAVAPALAACATAAPETAPAPVAASAATATAAAAAPASGGPQEPTPLAHALADAIRVQYGDRMTEAEMAKVQRSISGMLATAERVRRFPLPIATEPTFAYRVPGGA